MNVAYEEEEERGFFKLTLVALIFTAGLIVFVLLALAAVLALPVALNYIPLAGLTTIILKIARWPILFVLVAFAPVLGRSFWHLARPVEKINLKRIGITEIVYSLVFLVFITLTFRLA